MGRRFRARARDDFNVRGARDSERTRRCHRARGGGGDASNDVRAHEARAGGRGRDESREEESAFETLRDAASGGGRERGGGSGWTRRGEGGAQTSCLISRERVQTAEELVGGESRRREDEGETTQGRRGREGRVEDV